MDATLQADNPAADRASDAPRAPRRRLLVPDARFVAWALSAATVVVLVAGVLIVKQVATGGRALRPIAVDTPDEAAPSEWRLPPVEPQPLVLRRSEPTPTWPGSTTTTPEGPVRIGARPAPGGLR
ncbi:hypothetical protein Mal64_18570 [Pseudobythopirellula maris]|uniref:Uncharacterized protein n=1 Tax=Pseudobythopirellula maris TaxID=2527991 RepID=A0A5C5ZN23_9BACT|nr:hypothetical protein [Pseudobythopirellula maris]TWT88377.1 hypothetical protein Mal64_18570 [Pseudobythopirellula maris]